MHYPAHAAFVAPARTRPETWRLLLGLMLTGAVYMLGIGLLYLILLLVSGPDGAQRWMLAVAEADQPTGTLLLLSTFAGMALGPMLAARILHRRSGLSLFGGPPGQLWFHFAIAALITAAVYVVFSLLPDAGVAEPQPNLELGIWASFLPLAMVGVLLQTGAEEVLFRGYIQQQLAARFRSPLAWMVLPSVVFGLAHFQPDLMGDNTWLIVIGAGLFGLIAADLTAATGSIGAAWGLHFANNAAAILFLATDGPLSGLALFTAPIDPSSPAMRAYIVIDLLAALGIWAAIRFAVTRPRRPA